MVFPWILLTKTKFIEYRFLPSTGFLFKIQRQSGRQKEDIPKINPKFYYFMAHSSHTSSWCYRIKINGAVSVSTIKRSGSASPHIFTLSSWIAKPSFNSLDSHSAGSTEGSCCVRSCQSCGFPQKLGSWRGKQTLPQKTSFQWVHWSCCRLTAGLPKWPLSQEPVSVQRTAASVVCKWPRDRCDLALPCIFLLLSIKAAFKKAAEDPHSRLLIADNTHHYQPSSREQWYSCRGLEYISFSSYNP